MGDLKHRANCHSLTNELINDCNCFLKERKLIEEQAIEISRLGAVIERLGNDKPLNDEKFIEIRGALSASFELKARIQYARDNQSKSE